MNFRTKIDIKESTLRLDHKSRMLLIGSCFAENIGELLLRSKFSVLVNPFGIVYNPSSISAVLRRVSNNLLFKENDLFEDRGLFHSFYHHSNFSSDNKEECLERINTHLMSAFDYLRTTDILVVTLGTAYVYYNKTNDEVVANCHKIAASQFRRERLTVDEIVSDWRSLIVQLRKSNPSLKVLFTVSPIRHWKDGAHENQLSKSILLLAIDALQKSLDEVFYFPAYEILLDDLRDYRFYANDMVHPSSKAIDYIWDCFQNCFFDEITQKIILEWTPIQKAISHRPFNDQTVEYQLFLSQTIQKIKLFGSKYPYINSDKEVGFLVSKLK